MGFSRGVSGLDCKTGLFSVGFGKRSLYKRRSFLYLEKVEYIINLACASMTRAATDFILDC